MHSEPAQLDEPVGVTGKVVSSDGKPVGEVVVNLQPLENGYLKAVDVDKQGAFKVETHPGKYAYFFSPAKGKAVPAQAASLTEANMERTVTVASGQELVITLP